MQFWWEIEEVCYFLHIHDMFLSNGKWYCQWLFWEYQGFVSRSPFISTPVRFVMEALASYLTYHQRKKKKKQNKAVEGGIFLVFFFFFFENIVGTDTLKISHYLHMILYLWSRPYPAPSLEMYSSMLWSSIKIENQFEQVRDTSWRSRGGLNLEELSGILGCNVAHLPLKCLGLFLGAQFKSKII